MANLVKTLDSGAKVEIQLASFEVCNRLLKAVMREIKDVTLNLGIKGGMQNLAELEVNDDSLNTIKSLIAQIISSDRIEEALWECMPVVLYNGAKVTKATFEPVEARGDYLPLAKEVLVYNLGPFTKSLSSSFVGILKGISSPKQI
jgi:hypothetical protein